MDLDPREGALLVDLPDEHDHRRPARDQVLAQLLDEALPDALLRSVTATGAG
jgi:hypothetical protein